MFILSACPHTLQTQNQLSMSGDGLKIKYLINNTEVLRSLKEDLKKLLVHEYSVIKFDMTQQDILF